MGVREQRDDPPGRPDPRHDRRRDVRRGVLPPLSRRQGARRVPPPARDAGRGGSPGPGQRRSILATGLLTGAPVSTATRFNAIARSPAHRRLRRVGGRRLLGPRAEDGRARRDHPHRAVARARLPLGEGRRGRDPRRPGALGPGPADRPGRDQGGGRREERARPPDRPGRREPRPLRDAHERAAPLQRPHRDGRRHGLQERAGDRGEGLAEVPRAGPRRRGPRRDRQAPQQARSRSTPRAGTCGRRGRRA